MFYKKTIDQISTILNELQNQVTELNNELEILQSKENLKSSIEKICNNIEGFASTKEQVDALKTQVDELVQIKKSLSDIQQIKEDLKKVEDNFTNKVETVKEEGQSMSNKLFDKTDANVKALSDKLNQMATIEAFSTVKAQYEEEIGKINDTLSGLKEKQTEIGGQAANLSEKIVLFQKQGSDKSESLSARIDEQIGNVNKQLENYVSAKEMLDYQQKTEDWKKGYSDSIESIRTKYEDLKKGYSESMEKIKTDFTEQLDLLKENLATMNESKVPEWNEKEKLVAAYALNLCTVSVSQIVDYDDLNILEQEYDAILNNLNLENFPHDEALLKILKQILDTVTFFRIQEGDKKFVEQEYQQKMKNAIWSAVPNLTVILASGNPIAIATSIVSQVGIGYMNYRKQKSENSLEYEKQMWQLQRAAIEQFNALRRELFDTAWRMVDTYKIPDNYRLTESQISQYNNILMDSDVHRKYERLKTIEIALKHIALIGTTEGMRRI